jgi:arylsulfatase A-like enzyme
LQRIRGSSGRFVVKALFLGLVCGVVAGLVSGVLEIRAQRYLEQGLSQLAVMVLCQEMNRALRYVLGLTAVLTVLVAFLRILSRSWVSAAVYCLGIVSTVVVFVLSTNLLLYRAALRQSSAFLQNFQHTIAPEQVAKLTEPVRGTFLGVYSLLFADFAEHWGKILLLCLFTGMLGMGAGWLMIRVVRRVHPGILSDDIPARWKESRAVRMLGLLASWKAAGLALLGLMAVHGIVAALEHGRARRLADRPNVILISVDTLRADHLGCYGYGQETSPAVDGLARQGVLFEEVLASSPWTLPSHVSMVTSLSPAAHACSLVTGAKVRKKIPTLAEILWNRGYQTHGITTILYLTKAYGFDQGFRGLVALGHRARAERVTDEAIEWLKGKRDERFFLFLHYYDPHSDYTPPARYKERFDPGYQGPIDGSVPNLLEHQDQLTEGDFRHLVALYDGEVAYVDDQLARLFDQIKQMGLWDRSVIVFTSDHGEEFREHGSFGHGFTLYDEQLLVPLVICWPGRLREGHRVKEAVQLIDVVPTVLEMVGVEGPKGAERFEGKSLVSYCQASAAAPAALRDAFSQTELGENELYADRVDGAKAIYNATSGRWELYDLVSDPGETTNLAGRDRERLAALSSKLDPYILHARRVSETSQREAEKVELDEKSIETLKSLGYVQ